VGDYRQTRNSKNCQEMKGDASVNARTVNCDTRELIRDEGDEMEHCMEMSFIHFSVDTYGTGEQS
jgi:hypothetical protein